MLPVRKTVINVVRIYKKVCRFCRNLRGCYWRAEETCGIQHVAFIICVPLSRISPLSAWYLRKSLSPSLLRNLSLSLSITHLFSLSRYFSPSLTIPIFSLYLFQPFSGFALISRGEKQQHDSHGGVTTYEALYPHPPSVEEEGGGGGGT